MAITAFSAYWFVPFVWPICFWAAWSDLARMRIPNKAVMALGLVFLVGGLFLFPFETYLWRLAQLVIVLLIGVVMNGAGMVGAGDAKFAAAAAPFIAAGDLRLVVAFFAANLLAAVVTHRLVRITPLRRLAPDWQSWDRGWDFPMGLSLGATLAAYLALALFFGS
jgi:prepilin peptidase CpaA